MGRSDTAVCAAWLANDGLVPRNREAVNEAAQMLERRDAELAAATERAAAAEARAARLSALGGASQVRRTCMQALATLAARVTTLSSCSLGRRMHHCRNTCYTALEWRLL